jgi:hypothetical protein
MEPKHLVAVESAIADLDRKGERLIHLMETKRAIAQLRSATQQHGEHLEELRQEYETVLGILESEFLGALISGNWTEFEQFVESFKAQ